MKKRKANEYFHVYVLTNRQERNVVKVGKSNNLRRVPALVRMEYADIKDWEQVATFPVSSSHGAIAVESMAIAKLTNEGYSQGRTAWTNSVNGRASWADECFSCSAEHAIAVVQEMADIYAEDVV